MEDNNDINLLLANDSIDDVNRLINLLNSAEYNVTSELLDSPATARSLLKQNVWDLAIIQYNCQKLPPRELLQQLKKLDADTAVILLSEDADQSAIIEGLRMGAEYVVPMDEDQYLLLAVAACLANLRHRRRETYWENQYKRSEQRCDRLMDSSRDAIAVVQEGTYVYVNEPYARLFGYQGPEGMALIPVVDSIAENSQEQIKNYLKPLSPDQIIEDTTVDVIGIKPDEGALDTTLNVSQIEYQGETALQFLVSRELLTSELDSPSSSAEGSMQLSDIQPRRALDEINKAILKASRTEEQSILFYIRIDQISDIAKTSGPVYAEQLIAVVLGKIVEMSTNCNAIVRFSEDAFVMLVENGEAERGRVMAEDICRDVAATTFTAGNESVLLSLTVCVSVVNDAVESALACINQCQRAISDGDKDLQKLGSEHTVYVFENKADHKLKSEEQVIEFGRTLLEKRLIGIAFQPIAALQGKTAEYYEVLMRPKVDEYPETVPDDFIARIFKTKVASEIDRWVILESIKILAHKLKQRPATKLFINLSAATIQDAGFTAWLKVALQAAQISPDSLLFQLREIDVGRYIDQSSNLIEQLKAMNSGTALTHFGLAINPLLVLEKLPVDFVKIDMVIVESSKQGEDDAEVLNHLLSALGAFPAKVIVPFVENPTILPTLWQNGVDYIQGHYIQAPEDQMNYDFTEDS